MALNHYFSPSFILYQVNPRDKADLFSKFSDKAYTTNLISNKNELYEALVQQENLANSGMEQGVAIAHIRTPLTRKCFFMLAILKNPLEFGTLDNTKVNIVALLCVPPDENHLYLQLLARISRILRNEQNRNAILNTVGLNALYQLVESMGSWDISIEKTERYLMQLTLHKNEIFEDVADCLLELGIIHAQVTRAIPLKKYISRKLSALSHPDFVSEGDAPNSILISGVVSDIDIGKKLHDLLMSRNIDFSVPGIGGMVLTEVEQVLGCF